MEILQKKKVDQQGFVSCLKVNFTTGFGYNSYSFSMLTRRKHDKHDHLNKSSPPPHPRLKRCNSLKVATAQRYLAKKPHITSPCFGDLHQPCPMKDVYPSPKKLTYPTKRAIRKIIDSKVPFKGGYAGSHKGKCGKLCDSFLFIPILLENAGRSSGRFQPSVAGPTQRLGSWVHLQQWKSRNGLGARSCIKVLRL